jgi:hypothetical protein
VGATAAGLPAVRAAGFAVANAARSACPVAAAVALGVGTAHIWLLTANAQKIPAIATLVERYRGFNC